jgi:hypothetical protein
MRLHKKCGLGVVNLLGVRADHPAHTPAPASTWEAEQHADAASWLFDRVRLATEISSSLDTEQMLIVAAAGAVEEMLDHRWPPG